MKSKNPIIPGNLVESEADFTARLEFAKKVGNAIHIDVTDPDFVEGISLPVEAWPQISLEYAEAHLMVANPLRYFATLKEKGIVRAIVHVESDFDPTELQATARELDLLLGFAINPDTDLTRLLPLLAISSYAQVMSIYPGKTGQPYLPQTPLAVKYLRTHQSRLTITVDGGVSVENIPELKTAGADYFIASSAIYDGNDWTDNYQKLLNVARA